MFATFKTTREMTTEELREALSLMEHQETTDRFTSTSMHIRGDDAVIDVEIDENGNVTLI